MSDVLGTAFVIVRAITDQVAGDIKDGIKKGVSDAESDADSGGKDIGETTGESAGDSFLEEFGRKVRAGLPVAGRDVGIDLGGEIGKSASTQISQEISDGMRRDQQSMSRAGTQLGDVMGRSILDGINVREITRSIGSSLSDSRTLSYFGGIGRRIGKRVGDGINDGLEDSDIPSVRARTSIIGGLIAALALLATAAIPVLGAIVAGIAAFAPAFAGAGAAVGAFAVVAVGHIGDIKDAFDDFVVGGIQKVAPAFRPVIRAVEEFRVAYQMLLRETREPFLELATTTLQTFADILHLLGPVINDVTHLFIEQMETFRDWTRESDGLRTFIDWVRTNGIPFLESFIDITKNIVLGLAGLIGAFTPLAHEMMDGLEGMTDRFARWSQTLSDNQGFQDFISYVRRVGPQVLDLLGAIVGAIVNLARALAPIGDVALSGLTSFFDTVASMDTGTLRVVSLAIIGIIGSVTLLGPLAGPLSTFVGALGGLLTLGAGGTVTTLVAGLAGLAAIVYALTVQGEQFNEMVDAIKDLWAALVPVLEDTANALKPLLNLFEEFIAPIFQEAVEQLAKAFKDMLPIVKPLAVVLGVVLLAALGAVALVVLQVSLLFRVFGKIIQALGPIIDWIAGVFKKAWDGIKRATGSLVGFIKTAWGAIKNAVSTAASSVRDAVQRAWNWVKNATQETWNTIKNAVQEGVRAAINFGQQLLNWFRALPGNIKSAVGSLGTLLVAAGLAVIRGLWDGARQIFSQLRAWFGDLGGFIKDAIGDLSDLLYQAGKDIIYGLKDGVTAAWDETKGFFSDFGSGIKDTLTSPFDLGSPSRAMFKVGQFIIQGLEDGMVSRRAQLRRVVSGLARDINFDRARKGFDPGVGSNGRRRGGGPGEDGGGYHLHVHNPSPERASDSLQRKYTQWAHLGFVGSGGRRD